MVLGPMPATVPAQRPLRLFSSLPPSLPCLGPLQTLRPSCHRAMAPWRHCVPARSAGPWPFRPRSESSRERATANGPRPSARPMAFRRCPDSRENKTAANSRLQHGNVRQASRRPQACWPCKNAQPVPMRGKDTVQTPAALTGISLPLPAASAFTFPCITRELRHWPVCESQQLRQWTRNKRTPASQPANTPTQGLSYCPATWLPDPRPVPRSSHKQLPQPSTACHAPLSLLREHITHHAPASSTP